MLLPKLPVTVNEIALEFGRQYPAQQYPTMEDRIVKAVDLIVRDRIKWIGIDAYGGPIYECISSDDSSVYTVGCGNCTCPARTRTLCYHRIARGILVTQAANKTAIDFCEALAVESSEPPAPLRPSKTPVLDELRRLDARTAPTPKIATRTADETNQRAEHPVFVAPVPAELRECGEHPVFTPTAPPVKRVQSVGKMDRKLTTRYSMDGLGKLLREAWAAGPFAVKA